MTPGTQIPSPQVANIGAKLRRLRKERDLTQADLARQIGIQQSDLSRMEKGEYRVSLDNLIKLLNVFDVQISEFFGESAERSQPMQRPLSREDMQLLHLLRQLSDEGRREAMEFLEFKLRREQQDRRAVASRRDESGSGS
jgi:transcriptional regulator with XRE-family HTH domain